MELTTHDVQTSLYYIISWPLIRLSPVSTRCLKMTMYFLSKVHTGLSTDWTAAAQHSPSATQKIAGWIQSAILPALGTAYYHPPLYIYQIAHTRDRTKKQIHYNSKVTSVLMFAPRTREIKQIYIVYTFTYLIFTIIQSVIWVIICYTHNWQLTIM